MPIKPEEINASQLPVALRGYQREAVDEFLLRIAWDYRQATRAHENWAKDERWLKERVAELEAQIAGQEEQWARLQESQRTQFREELDVRSASLTDELARLRKAVAEHEGREEMTRTLLQTAQRTAREMREATRTECEGLLKAAHRRADEIEHEARSSLKHTAAEVERLRRLEAELKAHLQQLLESVLGKTEQEPEPEPESEQAPPFLVR